MQAFHWKEESTQEKEKLMMWCTRELLGLCHAFLPHMVCQRTMETVAPSHSPTSTFHLVPTLLTALCTLPKFFLCFENKKWRLKGYWTLTRKIQLHWTEADAPSICWSLFEIAPTFSRLKPLWVCFRRKLSIPVPTRIAIHEIRQKFLTVFNRQFSDY